MARRRVLTVDDSAAIVTMIAAYLESSEFEVVAAERDGVMALERFAQQRPEIVLLDLLMPSQPCIDTRARILAIDPEALVVVLSSTESDRAVSECLSAGAQSFFHKPFTKNEFVEFLGDLRRAA